MALDLELDGRGAIITGASAGLGLAATATLLDNGARVVMVARGAERLNAAREELAALYGDDNVIALSADVTDTGDIERVVATATNTFGGVDILLNNAGEAKAGPFVEQSDATWSYDIDLKLMAAVRLSRLCVPLMKQRGGGRIVNVLNTMAKAPGARTAPTSVTRAAGLALTKALASEFAPDRILVNAVCIGLVKSDQWVRSWEARGRQGTLDEQYAAMGRNVPLGRVGEAGEFGDLVAFLVSARAAFITGTAINFDGGASAVV